MSLVNFKTRKDILFGWELEYVENTPQDQDADNSPGIGTLHCLPLSLLYSL